MAYQINNTPIYAAQNAGLDWWNQPDPATVPVVQTDPTKPVAAVGPQEGAPPISTQNPARLDPVAVAAGPRPTIQPGQPAGADGQGGFVSPFANFGHLDPNTMQGRADIVKGLQQVYTMGQKLGKSPEEIRAAQAELGSQIPRTPTPIERSLAGPINGFVNMWDGGTGSNSS